MKILELEAYFFIFIFCFANSFVLHFLRGSVSVLGGADARCLHRERNVNFITEDVFASNI